MPRLRADPADPFAGWQGERWLEVGAGGGEHALAQAASHPQAMLVACEVFLPGLCSMLSRLVVDGQEANGTLPPNLRIWDDDARPLLRALPDATLSRLFLLFPDPWPKARHAKRRFVHPELLPDLARVMQPGAEWLIASDDPTYQSWVAQVFAGQSWFTLEPAQGEAWLDTRYRSKALAAGRVPMNWIARRRP